MKEQKVIYDEDSFAVIYRAPIGSVKECAEQWFNFLFDKGVDIIIYECANPDVVYLKDCPHGELWYERFKQSNTPLNWHAKTGFMELIDQGTDILDIVSRIARSHGKSVFAQMRMSDAHHYHGGYGNPNFPQFAWDHPELCIQKDDGTPDIVLDYSFPEVRARRLAILRDIVENYDVDGINLNWMRWCRHFAKGKQRKKAPILTEFLREVRKMLDDVAKAKGCQRYMLSHFVATELEESLNIGCDVKAWAQEGLADFIMPMDFLCVDFNIKTDEFVKAAEGTDCGVYPVLQESMSRHTKGGFSMSVDKFRAAINNTYSWGADGISCFNFCCWGFVPTNVDKLLTTFEMMSSPKILSQGRRHYQYVPIWRDYEGGICPTGKHSAQILQFRSDEMDKRLTFTFRMADGRDGERLKGTLIARIDGGTPVDVFELDINGKTIPADKVEVEDKPLIEAHAMSVNYPPGIKLCVRLEDCPDFAGDNELGIRWKKKTANLIPAPKMEVLEVIVEP